MSARCAPILGTGVLTIALCCPLFAQDSDSVPAAGSPERRQLCTTLGDIFVGAHEQFVGGTTFARYQKEMEIQFAGDDKKSDLLKLILLGVSISEYYALTSLAADDLRIDFLHPCITTDMTLFDVILELWKEKIPSDHPIQARAATILNPPASYVAQSGEWANDDYRKLLGGALEGTQASSAYARRQDGKITGCGYEFAHMEYEETYAQGRPVKVTGSINILEHTVSPLAALVKIKGEDIVISSSPDGSAAMESIVFEIEYVYPTLQGDPILVDTRIIECEDPEYVCHINFQWDRVSTAVMLNVAGIGYRRAGEVSDVLLELDWLQPPEGSDENEKFNSCMGELLDRAEEKLEKDG